MIPEFRALFASFSACLPFFLSFETARFTGGHRLVYRYFYPGFFVARWERRCVSTLADAERRASVRGSTLAGSAGRANYTDERTAKSFAINLERKRARRRDKYIRLRKGGRKRTPSGSSCAGHGNIDVNFNYAK